MTQSPEQLARQAERERYVKTIRACYAAFKNTRLYSPEHPTTKESAQKFVGQLETIFQNRFDFPLKQIDGLLVVDDYYFIEESLMLYDLLRALESRNISQVLFLPGIQAEEVVACCVYLQKSPAGEGNAATQADFSNDHIQTSSTQDKEKNKKDHSTQILFKLSSGLYQEWLELTDKTLTKLLEEQNVPLADLSIPLDRLIDAITQRPADFALLICSQPVKNIHLQHALNTTIQAIFLGDQMGFDPTSIKVLALGALFHDIGRCLLPSDFTTGYKLDPSDTDIIQLHARDGASFLAGVQGLPMSAVRAALEHHIGFDGLGYPSLPASQKPHIFSQIISLADFVSWATVSERTYHKPTSIHRILRSALHRSGTQFSPLLVKLLLPFFGLFPPGTLLELSTGEKAVSMVPNLSHIARPLVLVLGEDNRPTPRSLAAVADNAAVPFPSSIKRIVGRHKNIESLIAFLPDSTQPAL